MLPHLLTRDPLHQVLIVEEARFLFFMEKVGPHMKLHTKIREGPKAHVHELPRLHRTNAIDASKESESVERILRLGFLRRLQPPRLHDLLHLLLNFLPYALEDRDLCNRPNGRGVRLELAKDRGIGTNGKGLFLGFVARLEDAQGVDDDGFVVHGVPFSFYPIRFSIFERHKRTT
jgi:hypothetical protein